MRCLTLFVVALGVLAQPAEKPAAEWIRSGEPLQQACESAGGRGVVHDEHPSETC